MPDAATPAHDLVIRGALVIDGTGAPRRASDVGVTAGRISALAAPGSLAGQEVLSGDGLILAPGFIDVHTHDDLVAIDRPEMTPKISQGVTTVIAGNCGISLAPLTATEVPAPLNLLGPGPRFCYDSVADYAEAVDAARPATNVCLLVGHGSLRLDAMADLSRKASAAELDRMRRRLDTALAEGAIGLSTGLYYKISEAADIDEIVALAELLPAHGGVYTTHMRDEHDLILDSLDETFTTARRAKVRVIVSHHKCAGPQNWGRSSETLAVIEAARSRQEVGLDVYPYIAGSTVLDPVFVDERIRITVSWSTPHPEMAGRDLADIAAAWGIGQREAAERLHPAGGIYYNMSEDDVRRILAYPHSMVGSDGLPQDAHPHPRLWGTFPRVLGRYCRDQGLFDLETAVRKMTGLAAETFGLPDRGVIREGAAADLVLFNPETVIDKASFDAPLQPADGIVSVVVNGVEAWRKGEPTGRRSGRLLSRARMAA
ncbi:N-acyl-D-amino-acid deacylase family protein [Roseisalinus antarcticus]|uniref:D-aminoacylase n=1 Tax=Roseisalinus antarcticus TaxID=254357 RepID=A0A1Y5T6R5_9RHOB|nr:D-aminoacylase [Roseisalinus antarcticus]SLN53816.1 D-aminoacylase [Roseisalinus antarcticus]